MLALRTDTNASKFAGVAGGTWNDEQTMPARAWVHPALLQQVRAGQEVYAEGDEARSLYKVVRGVVRTCRYLSDGRRQVSAFHVAGEVFGFEPGDVHRLTAEAVTECVVAIDRDGGDAAKGGTDPRHAERLFAHAMRRAERAERHALLLGRRGAAERVAGFLLEQDDQGGQDGEIDLVMSRQDIADYLGLTIETVSRTLSQLERDAVIAIRSPRHIVLTERDGLRDLAA